MLETGVKVFHVRSWDLATLPKPAEIPPYDGHGGSSETSVMMYLCPDDVCTEEFLDSKPEIDLTRFGSVFPEPSSLYSRGPAKYPLMMGEMVEHGHQGTPGYASAARGEALIQVKADALVEFITAVKSGAVSYRRPSQE